jgi:hypothetical protein
MYLDSYIDGLPKDPETAQREVFSAFLEVCDDLGYGTEPGFRKLLEWYALIEHVVANAATFAPPPPFTGNEDTFFQRLESYVRTNLGTLKKNEVRAFLEVARDNVSARLKPGFAYQFSEADYDRIQAIINQLRDSIAAADFLTEDHRARILRRLERLQAEFHKRMSDLDRLYGLVLDVATVAGQAAEKARPMVKLAKELLGLLWLVQTGAEGLPSSTPNVFLPEPAPPLLDGPS